MSRVLLVLIAVLALAGAAVWFTTQTGAARGSPSTEAGPPAADVESGAHALAPAPAAKPEVEPRVSEQPSSPPVPVAAQPARRVSTSIKDAELARAQWIDGRVLFPAGTPEDEEVFVTADGKNFEDGSDQRVKVGRDGSFRVAFSEKTRTGHFELEARYLYMNEIMWKRAASNGTVVLEPKLGARIAGRVRVPAGWDASQVAGQVQLEVSRRAGNSFDNEQRGTRKLSKNLDFAFDALAPGKDPERCYALLYEGEDFIGRSQRLVPEGGRTLTVELELIPGLSLAGIVRDESGAPLEGATVDANVQPSSGSLTGASWRQATSGDDGSFHIGALAYGEVSLQARLAGYVPLRRELGRLEEGQDIQDLVLVLARGSSISGTVRWPDGSPAEAYLVLTPLRTSLSWESSDNKAGKSDASGAFVIGGLAQKSYRVTARAKKTEEVLVKSTATGKERPKAQTTQWSAEIDPVQAGTQDLVLTLSNGLTVAGRVVDDLGTPLEDFGVKAELVGSGPNSRRDAHLSSSFRGTDGSFRMGGFAPGEWKISGWSKHHAGSEPVSVTLPGNDPVLLVVPREAIVSGRVLDPAGAPVGGASVCVIHAEPRGPAYVTADVNRPEDETNELGTFRIYRLGPGAVTLEASGAGWVRSVPESLVLKPGETRSDIVLRLRPGGTIQGELIGADGRPQSGPTVWVNRDPDSETWGGFKTDVDGRFWVTGVPPGDVDIRVETLEGIRLEQRVSVAVGETVYVRLRPPGRGVRLHGHLRAGGEPLAKARVWASREDEGFDDAGIFSDSEAGDDGGYELVLPGAGRFWLSINGGIDASLSWRVALDVPEVESLEFDVSIPVGRISGRVTDTQGQAVAGVFVESEPEHFEGGAHGSARALTDDEGRYELLVPAGQHAVKAGGTQVPWLERPKSYADSRVLGLAVGANAHVGGIDLVLASGGILEGVAHKARSGYVQIWSEGEENGRALGWTDEDGHFELRGVTPGVHFIGARGRAVATRRAVRVEVVAGERRQVELELVPASLVHLTVRERGVLVGCEIGVLDEQARRQPVRTSENGEAWLGPLVSGRYTVSVRRDGRQVERVLEVSAEEEELKIELVFE